MEKYVAPPLQSAGVSLNRFVAFDRTGAKAAIVKRGYIPCSDFFCKVKYNERLGSQACYMSHLTLLEKLKTQFSALGKRDVVLVLEDDVTLDPSWRHFFVEAMPYLPGDWDIVYVCFWGGLSEEDRVNKFFYLASFVPHKKRYMGTCGYMVQPHRGVVLNALHQQAQSDGIEAPDVALLNDSKLVRYAMRQLPFHHMNGTSAIKARRLALQRLALQRSKNATSR